MEQKLQDIIAERIRADGPISFADFMEACLYYPRLGYYMNEEEKIGAGGDFYTSPLLSASFGAMLGRQLEEFWYLLGARPFTVVEYGAGTGMLSFDILQYLKGNPALYEKLRYCIIEISPAMRRAEQMHLKDKVCWYEHIDAVEGTVDCVFSNELLDNFPVHQVVMEEELMEVFVTFDGEFKEVLLPAREELKTYFGELNLRLPRGYRTEVNLRALDWIGHIARRLQRGYILTIDYGGCSEELYKAWRSCGTLVCYHQHKRNDQPFINIGKQDITAHVNFSALEHWGRKAGIASCGLTTQALFLLSLGFREHLRSRPPDQHKQMVQLAMEEAQIVHNLLWDMGQKIKVLVQARNMPPAALRGFALG